MLKTNIGELVITPSKEEGNDITSTLSSYEDFAEIDEATADKVTAINSELMDIAGQRVGYSEVNLISEDAETYTFNYFAYSYNPQWSVFSAISNQTKKNTK